MLDIALYSFASEVGARLNHLDPYHAPHYDFSKPRIKAILNNNFEWIMETYNDGRMRDAVLDNVLRTILCRTPFLGYDEFECPDCGDWLLIYRHCHSRFCTRCGVKLQRKLASKAEVMCINSKHRHVVFTIPENYRELFRTDRNLLNILFAASRNTLMKVFNKNIFDKAKRSKEKRNKSFYGELDYYYTMRNYKDIKIFGAIATLHTFGRDLKWNPHIHVLVPELVYNIKEEKCENFHHINFESLRKNWQYEVNRLLKEHYDNSKDKKLKSHIKMLINQSYKNYDNGFYVYAKYQNDSFDEDDKINNEKKKNKVFSKNVGGCVSYMMRYAGRPAMAENRIISYDKESDLVSWWYDDHKTNERITVSESGKELLGKMFIHIPEKNFRMVRYYGFYSSKERDLLYKIHSILGNNVKASIIKQEKQKELKRKLNQLKFRTLCADTYNRDILKCRCGSYYEYKDTYNPEGRTNERQYMLKCITEMRKLRPPGIYEEE